MTPAKATPKASSQTSIFGDVGIEIPTTEFFSADTKTQTVDVLAVRKPNPDDSPSYVHVKDNKRTPVWKVLGSGQAGFTGPDRIPILAIVDVEQNGRPMTWEISSSRLARALDACIDTLPATVKVRKMGSGTSTDFLIEKA